MNSDRSSVEQMLLLAGSRPVEPVGPRLDQLEARVMRTITSSDRQRLVAPLAEFVTARSRRNTVRPRLMIGAAAACLLAVVVLAAGWFAGGNDSYVIAAADDVSVVLPDGSVRQGVAGLELPVGTVIDVDGSLVIGEVTYGPGDYAVTVDGVFKLAGNSEPVTTGGSDGELAPVGTVSARPPGTTTRPPTTTTRTTTTRTTVVTAPTRPVDDADRVTSSTRPSRPDSTVVVDTLPASTDRSSTTVAASIPAPTRPPATTSPSTSPSTSTSPTTAPTTASTVADRPIRSVADQERADPVASTTTVPVATRRDGARSGAD